MSDFNGIRVALSSLYAQRRALDVTGQNIANVNTEGYSRQRVEMAAITSPPGAAIFSRFTGAGMGVKVTDITRMRDQFMDARAYQEHGVDAGLTRMQETLARIELAFDEPSDTGLAAVTAEFFSAWDAVANLPNDPATRAQLVEQAKTLTAAFAQLDASLAAQRDSSVSELSAVVDAINVNAGRVAELNNQIQAALVGGFPANELMDERGRVLDQLAEQAGVTVRFADDGTAEVSLGGTALVWGAKSRDLKVEVSTAEPHTATVKWDDLGYTIPLGGEAGALVTTVNDTLPRYRDGLLAVAQQLNDDVNLIHQGGYALDGTTTGIPFFVMTTNGLAVNPDIVNDPGLVAAAGAAGAPRDGALAQRIAALTGANDRYEELVVGLGIEAQAVNRRLEMQGAIVGHVDDARESAAGVNIDEEMTNMIAFQRAYEAAAKYLSVVDETLESLISLAGR